MNVFFTGTLWDLKPEGRVLTLEPHAGVTEQPPPARGKSRVTVIQMGD
jgi:hypothetical protein